MSTDRLPSGAYLQGDAVMVPLRLIGEQLGYQVTWDKASREAVMEDSIQKVALRSGSDAAVFTGKLQVIDLTRDVTLSSPAVIRGGTTYVPLTLFNEFFNETAVTGAQITVTTMTEELQTAPRG